MCSSEISDVRHWQETVGCCLSACDSSNRLANSIRTRPAYAHRLSTTTITSILEAFGAAIENIIRNRLYSCTEYAVMADESTNVNKYRGNDKHMCDNS